MQPETSRESGSTAVRALWPQVLVLVAAVALSYANSLHAPFLLDDPFLNAPDRRLDYGTRPLVWASWDLNRAISGQATWSYHVFNALVHLGCGLALLGVLRRGLAHAAPRLAERTRAGLALATALLWLCHPLQTSAVTYLSQRAESLTALCFLAFFYAFQRAASAARPRPWQAALLLALGLGFASKEIFATAPIFLLLYDALFLSAGVPAALRARRGFYAVLGLATLALVLAFTVPVVFLGRDVAAGFQLTALGPLEYARSQPGVVLHYLRLVFWPHPLCFDHGWPVATAARDYVPQTLVIVALLAATLVLCLRRSWLGFAGACFFGLLAPTSSFVPIMDLAFEHRMVLPLAAVLLPVVVGGWWLAGRFPARVRVLRPLLALSAALALGTLTVRRNQDYRSAVALMQSTAACAPHNPRAHANLAAALLDADRPQEAVAPLLESLALDPHAGLTYHNLGKVYLRLGKVERALPFFRRAVELIEDPRCHDSLGEVLLLTGDPAGAVPEFEAALALLPGQAAVHLRLARALARLQRRAQAIQHYQEALRLEPGLVPAQSELAALLGEPDRTGAPDTRIKRQEDARRAPR